MRSNLLKFTVYWHESNLTYLNVQMKSFIIELYSFIIEIKVVRHVLLNNIDINYQPSWMHRSPPRIRKNSMTPYIVLVRIKVVRNYAINNFKLNDQLSRIHSFHSKNM